MCCLVAIRLLVGFESQGRSCFWRRCVLGGGVLVLLFVGIFRIRRLGRVGSCSERSSALSLLELLLLLLRFLQVPTPSSLPPHLSFCRDFCMARLLWASRCWSLEVCGFATLSPPRSLRTRGLIEQSLPPRACRIGTLGGALDGISFQLAVGLTRSIAVTPSGRLAILLRDALRNFCRRGSICLAYKMNLCAWRLLSVVVWHCGRIGPNPVRG